MTGAMQYGKARAGVLVALAAALLLSGCFYNGWPFRRGSDSGRELEPYAGRGDALGREGAGWKVVTGKREPRFLLAGDGTECMVPQARWDAAIIGERALCIWSVPKS